MYSFYSYQSSKTFSFLNPIVLQGIKWIIYRSRIFSHTGLGHMMTNSIPQLLAKFHENLMWCLEDISQNVDFGPKMVKFGPKRAQKWVGLDFSRTVNLYFSKEDHKLIPKISKIQRTV